MKADMKQGGRVMADGYCQPLRQWRHIRSTFIGRNSSYSMRC